jgi:polyribonucleotide nucleotidyltransferase
MAFHRVEMELGGRTLSIETGKIAKQATAAVMVQYGETVVLGTVVHGPPREGIDFFPLTVDYREKYSAAGKFPGGFRKREGAPNTKEILTMRNIDRPLRPLFPNGFFDEVQIQCWVMSADGQNEPDVLAGIAASAALGISGVPFDGPVGNVRVARVEGQLVIMPTAAQSEYSDLDMLLCGHEDGLNMIEVGAQQMPEDEMAEAIAFGHGYIKQIVGLIKDLDAKAEKPKMAFVSPVSDEIRRKVDGLSAELKAAKTTDGNKLDRQEAVRTCIKSFLEREFPEPAATAGVGEFNAWRDAVKNAKVAIHDLEEKITREIIRSGSRTDGRSATDLRNIEAEVGLLPRVHGSALFTRGETQALVTCGAGQRVVTSRSWTACMTEYAEKFYLHYNFPPFSHG